MNNFMNGESFFKKQVDSEGEEKNLVGKRLS